MTITTQLVPNGLVGANLVPCGLVGAQAGGATIDYFNSLGMWLPVIGTFGVATGGGLKALTAGNVGINRNTNPEMTTAATGFTATRCALSRVDAIAEGIGASGGIDNWVLKVVTDASLDGAATMTPGRIIGANYYHSCRAYAPSSNSASLAATLIIAGGTPAVVTAENTWETLIEYAVAIATTTINIYKNLNGVENDVAYFDKLETYRLGSLALYLGPTQANGSYVWDLPMPASGVVPRGMVVRYASPLDYWEVRIKPGTAGNDTDIVEVVAGVETVRATADVDYSTSLTDQVKITLNGAVITVDVKKSGASAFTNATSYATMVTGLTQNRIGYMSYGLPGTSEVAKFEVVG